MGRSKGWQAPFSQMVPAAHSSSREQTGPPFRAGNSAVVVVAAVVAVVLVVLVLVVVVVVEVVVRVTGSSSACATWKGDSVAPCWANGSKLAAAQPGRDDRPRAAQVSAAATRYRLVRGFFIRARDR